MIGIPIYSKNADDFSTNGMGLLLPVECTVEEQAAGMYELTLVQPIDETLRWAQLQSGNIIKAPVPVRESPLYEGDIETETVVLREVYKVVNTYVGVRLRTGPGEGYKRLSTHKNDTLVIKLDQPSSDWMHVCLVNGGAVGYMATKYLELDHTETETITPEMPTGQNVLKLEPARDQLFRIYSVETDTDAGVVTAKAMHIFYDWRGNLIADTYEPSNTAIATVVTDIGAKLLEETEIKVHPTRVTGSITGDFSFKTPVEAYLDPDEGIVAQSGALFVRDNYDVYLLPDAVRDRGVTVRRGKNLAGVVVTTDESSVVTRIIPVGKDEEGEPLYLDGTKYVDSPYINSYPIPYAKRIEYDVKVGDPSEDETGTVFKTEEEARAELLRLAQAEFSENGADLPAYGMEVDLVLLGNTAEYANFAGLQAVHLYDTVTVIDSVVGINAKIRVTGYTWDVLAQQYESITLGELQDMQSTVYSYNLPAGSVSGSKIMPNSIGGDALRNLSIQYAKIAVAAIEQLNAAAIEAIEGKFDELVANSITTEELKATIAEIVMLKVGSLTADDIVTDTIVGNFANFNVITAGTAEFDKATIQHLVANAMNLEFGVGEKVFINNLAVKYAQMVGATIGDLCIKASDGNYYNIDVDADGNVTATKTTVTDGEINAGQTDAGKVILGTDITAENLNTTNLLATYALINKIDAARIDVDQLFAREAFITLLRTSRIMADGGSLEIIAQNATEAKDTADAAATAAGSAQTSADEALEEAGSAADNANDAKDKADAAYNAYQDAVTRPEFERVVRIDTEGLHVGDNLSNCEVLIDSGTVHIVVGGQIYTSYGGGYLQLGDDIRIRRPKTGGVAFCPIKG